MKNRQTNPVIGPRISDSPKGPLLTFRSPLRLSGFAVAALSTTLACQPQPSRAPTGDESAELAQDSEEELDDHADAMDADAADDDEDAEPEEDEPSIEEQLALDAVRAELSQDAGPDAGPLRFAVVQRGPRQPWVMGVVNQGPDPAMLVADPRLVSFDVKVPGKKKVMHCALPDALRPARPHRGYRVRLAPGEGVVKAFDPRLYCFASSGQHILVPGAIVTPKFGWPEKVKTVWRKGRRETVKLEQSEPFVARVRPGDAQSSDETDEPADTAENSAPAADSDAGVTNFKELVGTPLALDSNYQEWSSVGIPRERKLRSPIVIDMQQGSDAHSQLSATVAITLKNRSQRAQQVYFRRELLSFEVMGPGGPVSCDPQPDTREPDRQAFLSLAPNRSMTITSRLVELCPKGTFSRPGFYLVHARFETDNNGEDFGFDAYVGRVATEHPANVRIRTGELDPADRQALRPLQVVELEQ